MKNWQAITIFIILVLSGSLGLGVMLTPQIAPVEPAKAAPVVVDRPLLDMVNELRTEKGVHPLIASPELDASAKEKATDMATQHYFDHKSPDGINGWTLISNYLPDATRRSENLAICGKNDNNTGAFELWLNSSAHYQGMIDPTVTLYGTATAYDEVKRCTVYVNHFAAV